MWNRRDARILKLSVRTFFEGLSSRVGLPSCESPTSLSALQYCPSQSSATDCGIAWSVEGGILFFGSKLEPSPVSDILADQPPDPRTYISAQTHSIALSILHRSHSACIPLCDGQLYFPLVSEMVYAHLPRPAS